MSADSVFADELMIFALSNWVAMLKMVQTMPYQSSYVIRDKYKDAPLSGAFEHMHTNELSLQDFLHKLEASQNGILNKSPQSVNNETTSMDHTYCATSQYVQTIGLSNKSDHYETNASIQNNNVMSDLANLALDSKDRYEPIEVSMVLEDIPHNTLLATPGLNIDQPSVLVTCPNSEDHPIFQGANSGNMNSITLNTPQEHAVSGLNQSQIPTPNLITFTSKMETYVLHVLGVNSSSMIVSTKPNIQSSSSSEFEGFHSDDIYEITSHVNTSVWSSTQFIVMDSEDTVIYSSTTTLVSPNSSQNFYLAKQMNAQYSPDVINLWKNDAMKKKWTVPIVNLSKDDIYALSKPIPNWDKMDPYSGIEDIGSDSDTVNQDNDSQLLNKLHKRHSVHTKHHKLEPVNLGIRKSKRNNNRSITYTYDDASMSDSDYNPKPKPIKDPKVGLKGPSNSRMQAQAIIHAAKEKSLAARQNAKPLLILPFDKDRNQQCHHCGNTFYYSAGLKTHLDHAHKDILSVIGINDPNPQAVVVMKGTNNADVISPTAVPGSNIDVNSNPKPSTSTANVTNNTTPVAVEHTLNTSQASPGGNVSANQNVTKTHHKHKAKPSDKHY